MFRYETSIMEDPDTGRLWTRNYWDKGQIANAAIAGMSLSFLFAVSCGALGFLLCPVLLVFSVVLLIAAPGMAYVTPMIEHEKGRLHRWGACPWCGHITRSPSNATNTACQTCSGPIEVSPGVFMRMLDYRDFDVTKPNPPLLPRM